MAIKEFSTRTFGVGKSARPFLCALLSLLLMGSPVNAQKKRSVRKAQNDQKQATTQLEQLRAEYIKLTKEYKASLGRLLPLYEAEQKKAQQRLDQSKELFKQGLISKRELDNAEHAVADAGAKVEEVHGQMSGADTQVAQALVEVQQLGKAGQLRRGAYVKSASFIRYAGAGPWVLSQAGRIQNFFQQKFGHSLPIAVFGQGAIHNQWHLDHRNAMDVSLNPDGAEGQALMDFLRTSGIPFSAFRTAIPGVATGPHIHIGLPSHRY